MLNEAKKKAKGKTKESKPKVEKAVQDTVDPNTGQPIEVTKPAKSMTGNPANPIIVYPTTGGQSSVVDPRNPMRNSQVALLQSHTEKRGMLLHEYIDYARGKVINPSGEADIPVPTQADRDMDGMEGLRGDLGTDEKIGPAASVAAANDDGLAKFGDVNQRLRRRTGKRENYLATTGGNDDEYT